MEHNGMTESTFFHSLEWHPDRLLLHDLVFRLQHYKTENWDGGEHFLFCKIKPLVDQYEDFLRRRGELRTERVFELGIWDGGSVVFWNELFRPRKHVALDLAGRADSPYFRRYVESRGLSDGVRTFWRANQADKARLLEIAASEFDGPLDIVIDDASHLYGPTRASFEALFPLLAPGGLYLIEDWTWAHWLHATCARISQAKCPCRDLSWSSSKREAQGGKYPARQPR
jgi:hypothetical protein